MKKMRRLIPAIAMLLVSAVMLSTASFAWFTMNDQVTVEGMQIQAKADGSLLVSQEPLTATNGAADALINTGVKTLYPMAYYAAADTTIQKGATLTAAPQVLVDGTETAGGKGWYQPDENENSDITTGTNTGLFKTAAHFYKEEFYIATAGNAMPATTKLTINLTSPVHPATGETHKAYAAAIYLVPKGADDTATGNTAWGNDKDVATDAVPNAIIFVDTYDNRNTVELTTAIPSVAGAAEGTEVGLKVIVHFYVDGALASSGTASSPYDENNKGAVQVIDGYKYTANGSAAYNAEKSYWQIDSVTPTGFVEGETDVSSYYVPHSSVAGVYVPATGTYVTGTQYYSIVPGTADGEIIAGTKPVPSNWYTAEANYKWTAFNYVRSADIPAYGSTLALSFSVPSDSSN